MTNFKTANKFSVWNDYYTKLSAWKQIQHFIPKDALIWEAFLLNSNEQSKRFLQYLGFNVIGNKDIDFLNDIHTEEIMKKCPTIIVSNPPFEKISSFNQRHSNLKYKIFKKLFKLDIPFIIIMNSTNLFQIWFRELVGDKDVKFIIPSRKIYFDKYEMGGKKKIEKNGTPSFNSVYLTYKVLHKNEFIDGYSYRDASTIENEYFKKMKE